MVDVSFSPRVKKILKPVSEAHPAGAEGITRDLMRINDALKKNPPDYKQCIDVAEHAILTKRKSLSLAVRLTFAWFRKEKMDGLFDGLCLLLGLVTSFGESLDPNGSRKQLKAIALLEGRHFVALLKEEKVFGSNAAKAIEVMQVFRQFKDHIVEALSASEPLLVEFESILGSKAEFARKLLDGESTELETDESSTVGLDDEAKHETEKLAVSKIDPTEKDQAVASKPDDQSKIPTKDRQKGDLHTEDRLLKIFSGDSEAKSMAAMIEVACLYFERVQLGKKEKTRRTPQSGFIYSLTRSIIWGRIKGINAKALKAPNKQLRESIQQQYENEQWDLLIPKVELQLLRNRNDFALWLDAQYYIVNALLQKGDHYADAATNIKFDLAGLMIRFPELKYLNFADDKSVDLANATTREWIEEEIETIGGSSASQIELMPIMGEEYQSINDEFQVAKAEAKSKLEMHIEKIQKNLDGDTRRKGRFLRKLSLANLCLEANKFRLAKIHLSDLSEKIDVYQLAEWEPALCLAVWQSTWLANMKLIEQGNKNGIAMLEREQDDIYGKIAKLDSVRAMQLTNLSEE